MISIKQKVMMLDKLSKILIEMKSCKNLQEISERTGIPTSTIQRYLQRDDLLLELFEYNTSICMVFRFQIDLWLQNAKETGNQLGGIVTQKKYSYQKMKFGKFNGISRK